MNVYDFDGTIFPTDCAIGFFFWCMRRHPGMWFTFFPKTLKNMMLLPGYVLQSAALEDVRHINSAVFIIE